MAESTTDDSKALVRRFYAALDAGDRGSAMAMLADDFRLNLAGRPTPLDAGGLAEFGGTLFRAFPDLRHTIVQQIAEGDRVLTHLTFAGTHREEFQG
ncbi:MAG: ester cyclase, partial [Acidimicrobiales bacterium]